MCTRSVIARGDGFYAMKGWLGSDLTKVNLIRNPGLYTPPAFLLHARVAAVLGQGSRACMILLDVGDLMILSYHHGWQETRHRTHIALLHTIFESRFLAYSHLACSSLDLHGHDLQGFC